MDWGMQNRLAGIITPKTGRCDRLRAWSDRVKLSALFSTTRIR